MPYAHLVGVVSLCKASPMPHRDPLAAMATGLGTTHDMPASVRAALVALGSQQHLMRGCALFRQGDPADALYVVESGLLEVSILSPSGRKLTLNMLRKGTVFGEIAIFDGGLRSATVTAATPCVLLRIDRQALLEELRDNARFALDIIRLCVARVRWVSGQLEDHVFQPLTVRLARAPAVFAAHAGRGRRRGHGGGIVTKRAGRTCWGDARGRGQGAFGVESRRSGRAGARADHHP